ncbi:ubiquinol--cytochrome c reductase, cytochrome B subunit [Halarchaeum acidiphilum MH1-52-1]|uniref:Ubiquinol--cytochrome c reductase, cytochrome B subunit n=1 Tax=Halarchaeum acidiphilum MH1-52-1 TaxID=1261545 RepID=U3A757_9EURY|nr:cytochrome bc complex cytochrome b subunit [Halarchaeum acidiphilum]GAD53504.1 ubiquinol--cytochrome c reductase, cytochrome B subunit [Halarchaeum acidiphilum MH1-52-1]
MATTTDTDDAADAQKYEGSRVYRWLDDRLDLNDEFLGKAFPEDRYASFLLGEVTLFSFITLVLTGTFLGLLYRPGAESITYGGIAAEYAGKEVPVAFASVLRITYDIPMGMFIRMVHHWGAYLFIAAMGLHMLRVFFSGAYRNPRELNWIVGATLLFLGLVEGFMGYALPFDEYGSTATGIGFELAGGIPVIGETVKKLVFGGVWSDNASAILPRMFFYHVFLIPLILGGLIAVHMLLLIRQKHTEQKSSRDAEADVAGDDESVVTGVPLVPNQLAVTLIVFFSVLGALAFLAGLFPVQRLPLWGPNDPFSTPSGVAPDWYFMWVFGVLKIIPDFVPRAEFVGGVLVPGVVATVLALWPFIDYKKDAVHFTADPIERPPQTAVGVGAVTFVFMLSIDGMNATVANLLGPNVATATATHYLLYLTIIVPIVWALITYYVLKRGVERRESSNAMPSDDSDTAAAVSDD